MTSVDPPSPGRTAHVRMLFARLVEDIRRIERDYPVWDCGLADICEAALPDPDADAGEPTSEPASSTASATLESQLAVLRVTRQLGLVPGHEYRRQRRDIMCRIRARRLGHAPVLARVICIGVTIADGCEDTLRVLAGFTEKVHHWRTSGS